MGIDMSTQDQVAAELIKELNSEIHHLRVELTKERLSKHSVRRELTAAKGQLALLRQDRECEVF